MTRVWAVLNQKGGPGKTTLATNIAHGLILRGYKVLLGDTDPQGNARDWNAQSGGEVVPTVGLDRESLHADLRHVSKGYDFVVLDGAPQVHKLAAAAIKAASLVVIPVKPSALDFWATEPMVEVIKARQEVTDGLPRAVFAVSQAVSGTVLSREIGELLQQVDVPILKTGTTHLQSYPTVVSKGQTVFCAKKHKQAQAEIDAMIDELLEIDGVTE